MTMNEVQGFRKTLTARVAELERITRQRDGITIVRSAEMVEEVRRPRNARSRSAISTVIAANSATLARPSAEFRMAASGYVSGAMRISIPKRLAAVPWAAFCIHCQEAVDRNSEVFEMPVREFLLRAA